MKGKIACVILVFAFSAVCILGGVWQTGIYNDMMKNCTAQVTGIVEEKYYFDFDENDMPHSVETKYVSGKAPIHPKGKRRSYHSAWLIHIVVQTDDLFKLENIYADAEANHEGDTLIIHYDPDNPDNYCIGERADEYRTSGIFSYAMGGFFFVLGLLTAIFLYRLSKGTQTQEA